MHHTNKKNYRNSNKSHAQSDFHRNTAFFSFLFFTQTRLHKQKNNAHKYNEHVCNVQFETYYSPLGTNLC